MKRILFASAIIASSFAVSNAQTANSAQNPQHATSSTQQRPEVRAKLAVGDINNFVHLEGGQWAIINQNLVDYFKGYDALQSQKATLAKAEYDSKLKALRTTRDNALAAAMKGDQVKEFEAYKAQRKED
ncbi:MAG TPA: hypothetical protein VG603_03195 [Chitinophagales bacterium]|nr:hypothetical protein [Chitinophagales bacterium]